MNKPIKNGKVTNRFHLLQQFDITILNKHGKDNVVIDFIFILTSNENEPLIEYLFTNKHLFILYTNSLWFSNTSNYFVTGKQIHHLTLKEPQRIII